MIQAEDVGGNALYFDIHDAEIVLTSKDSDTIRVFFRSGMTSTLTAESGRKVLEAKLTSGRK